MNFKSRSDAWVQCMHPSQLLHIAMHWNPGFWFRVLLHACISIQVSIAVHLSPGFWYRWLLHACISTKVITGRDTTQVNVSLHCASDADRCCMSQRHACSANENSSALHCRLLGQIVSVHMHCNTAEHVIALSF